MKNYGMTFSMQTRLSIMQQMIKCFGILFFLSLWGCQDSSHESVTLEAPVSYIIDPEKASEYSLAGLISDVEYIQLNLPEGMLFAEVKKVVFDGSFVYALDISYGGESFKVYCFDEAGNFNFVIDKMGKGPGEYDVVYDFDITDDFVVLSTYNKIMYYDRYSGDYVKSFDKPDDSFMQMIGMLNEKILLTAEGRTKYNLRKKQILIYDIEERQCIFEAVSFEDHALKLGHTYRYIYRLKDTVSVIPIYEQIVYRLIDSCDVYSMKPAYKLDFGKFWIDEEILANSYKDRNRFFDSHSKYVHTPEVFETEKVIYVHYRLHNKDFTYFYDKITGKHLNISGFSDNDIGWIDLPIATYDNWIVNSISPWQLEDYDIAPGEELQDILKNTDDEGYIILVKARLRIH